MIMDLIFWTEHAPIHFDGNEVSKANSINILTVQENSVEDRSIPKPHHEVLQLIVREIGKAMGLRLFGVDVVVDAVSGRYIYLVAIKNPYIYPVNPFALIFRYAIVDVNA